MITKAFTLWVWVIMMALFVTPVMGQSSKSALMPLADRGSYAVGFRMVKFTDASRNGLTMNNFVWYPAIAPEKPTDRESLRAKQAGWTDAPPDLKAAPAPVILYSPGSEGILSDAQPILMSMVSHGFVVIGLQHPNDSTLASFVDRPMDVLMVIDQLATNPPTDFGTLIDTEHIGVMGGSYGAYTALAVTGARLDPTLTKEVIGPDWDAAAAYRATFSPIKNGELWPPYSDKRIQAAFMISVCGADAFGEKGLATASVPSLIVGGTSDPACPYAENDVYAFSHLGSPDRYLLSIIKGEHAVGLDTLHQPVLSQLATAFFGYYLSGQQDYQQYLTAKYIDDVEAQRKLGLVWGPYTGK